MVFRSKSHDREFELYTLSQHTTIILNTIVGSDYLNKRGAQIRPEKLYLSASLGLML